MTVYLLRHGPTEWSENGRHTGRTDLPLTADGEDKARQAGAVLRALGARGRVYASPRTRALRTAELAGLTVDEVTEDLAEWDYGDYEGLTTTTIRETVPDWTVWTHPCPGGETAGQITERANRVIANITDDAILVGHGHFSRVLIAAWIGQAAEFGVHFGLEAAGVSTLGDERGVPQIVRLNQH
ncbi:histidine phosphatase family protein [Actinokineospora sp. NBRC 105648]|uniref:histidine phosphatase family protein n=1 Tax=Actinokineospora sp. NBRC 105648 TaxID=3032206 RepID=UPI0024A51410|nr:histidine phosphatase family protein [Actinokineospora sp. NBRC 105648]GLZ38445.1 phosphoglycerate mutase [Actinokineospora sp. NBRC 105648]